MIVSTKPVMTVPQRESSGFFMFPSSRCETGDSVDNADMHCNSRASWRAQIRGDCRYGAQKIKGASCDAPMRLRLRSADQILRRKIPVHQIPERGDIIRPAVPVVYIVGVLPDVTGEQRLVRSGQWRGCIRRIRDVHRAVGLLHQPGPSGSEIPDRALRKCFLESGKGSEFSGDRLREGALGFAARARRQTVPVERVVPDLRGIVEDAAGGFADDLLETGILEFGALHQIIEIGDIGLMMLAVVEFQRFLRNMRLQGVQCVREGWELMLHLSIS